MKRSLEIDLANERVILATMIHAPEARHKLARELTARDFGDEKHKALFNAFAQLSKSGLAYSEDTITELSKGHETGGYAYLRALASEYDANANVDFHVERLRLDSLKYELLKSDLPSLVRECEDPTSSPERLTALIRAALGRVERNTRRFVTTGAQLSEGYYATLRARRIVGGQKEGFGFPILDSVLVRGFEPGGISVLVGRPGAGKSTLLAQLIKHRVRSKKGIFVGGWEMSKTDYLDMIVSSETGISSSRLVNEVGRLTEREKVHIEEVIEEMCGLDLLEIQERPFTKLERPTDRWADINERNLDYLESVLADVSSRGIKLFAFDVISKLIYDRRPDKVSEVLVRLSDMAKQYQVHLILLHHLNRGAAEGRPTLEGIKNSGAFEEEADNVFALDRPIMRVSPMKRAKMTDVLDFHILKQRKGPAPLCMRYRFDGARYSLTDEIKHDLSMLEDQNEEPQGGD